MTIKIFHRYMAMRFLKPFLFGLGIFAMLIFLGDLFDKMPRLAKSEAPFWVILQYLWLEVPYWAIRIIPMATLLATLFAVTGFVQSGEWIAVQASGFETATFFRPLLAMAVLVSLTSFLAQESILPVCFRRAQKLWQDQIHPEWEWDKYQNIVLVGKPGQFINAKTFIVKDGWLEQPVVDFNDGSVVTRQIDAKEAKWDAKANVWVFYNGVDRIFMPGGAIQEKPFKELASDIDVSPRALTPRKKDPDEMSLLETRRYMQQVSHLGESPRGALSAFHAKIAYPFSNLILCVLGIPIALKLKRANRAVSFGVALVLGFFYFWVMEMGKALGASDRMNPFVAAWMANFFFGILAAYLYNQVEV